MITRDLLRSLRNDLPMDVTIRQLGNKAPYSKSVEGRLRFQCHHCGDILVTINPRNNLAHCFGCGKNINNIDLMLKSGYSFTEAVALLHKWLAEYNKDKSGVKVNADLPAPVAQPGKEALSIGELLRQEFGNRDPARH